jgi:hypothetical protein
MRLNNRPKNRPSFFSFEPPTVPVSVNQTNGAIQRGKEHQRSCSIEDNKIKKPNHANHLNPDVMALQQAVALSGG